VRPQSRLAVLLRGYRPERPGTLPAGLVLVIIAGALFVAMFLNANSTFRKSNAKDRGPWRHDIAVAVRAVSCGLRFTTPHDRIDEALERASGCDNGSGPIADTRTPEQILADDRAAEERAQQASGSAPPTTPVPGKPQLRKPTPESPLRVWVGGDSVAGSFGPGFQRVSNVTKLFNVEVEAKVSSGLTRVDYYNWPLALRDTAKNKKPDIMIVMFGANDAQNMSLNNQALERFSPEWLVEYRKRVGSTMDLMRSPNNDRLVVWIGQPVMSQKSAAVGMDKLNYIFYQEARQRPWVAYFDAWPYFTDEAGNFAPQLPMADGKVAKIREPDGVHLNPLGADRLAWVVYGRLGSYLDLSANPTPPPLGSLPPATVQERPEVPRPPDWPLQD